MTPPEFALSGPSNLSLPAQERRVVLQRGLGYVLAAAGLASVVVAVIPGSTTRSISIAIGAAVGLLFTATWLVGAVLAFDKPWNQFGLLTFGMWPLRAFASVVVVLAGASTGLDLAALVLAWICAQAAGFAVESWAFTRLAVLSTYVAPESPEDRP